MNEAAERMDLLANMIRDQFPEENGRRILETLASLYEKPGIDVATRGLSLALITRLGQDDSVRDFFTSRVREGDVTGALMTAGLRPESIGAELFGSSLATLLEHVVKNGNWVDLFHLEPVIPETIRDELYPKLTLIWWFQGKLRDAVCLAQSRAVPRNTALALAELIEMKGEYPGWVDLIRRKRKDE